VLVSYLKSGNGAAELEPLARFPNACRVPVRPRPYLGTPPENHFLPSLLSVGRGDEKERYVDERPLMLPIVVRYRPEDVEAFKETALVDPSVRMGA
jgi:hypothetical protein